MKDKYPKIGETYYNHENKIGPVKVISIAELYETHEEFVIYQQIHKGTIGIILLPKWNEMINIDEREGCLNMRPRFYQ
jgi:hypothetical protein